MNRKKFIQNSGLLVGATLVGYKGLATMRSPGKEKSISFDLHTHPGVFIMKGTAEYPGDNAFLSRVQEMKSSGLSGAFFCLVADMPLLQRTDSGIVSKGSFKKGEGWQVLKKQLDILKALLKESEAELALGAGELAKGDHVKAYIASEGGDFLGGDISLLETAYKEGVRSVQLVHYAQNELGDLQTSKPVYNGLSDFGKEVVQKMNALGMVIDVAHASQVTVKDVVSLTTSPIILSHSILKEGEGRPIAARAISADHANMVAETGGVIGMWPSGFSASFDEFVDHTMRMVDTVGIDHVGIGTDMDANYKPVITDFGKFFQWKEALAQKGLSAEEVAKLAGGNAQRVLEAVL